MTGFTQTMYWCGHWCCIQHHTTCDCPFYSCDCDHPGDEPEGEIMKGFFRELAGSLAAYGLLVLVIIIAVIIVMAVQGML